MVRELLRELLRGYLAVRYAAVAVLFAAAALLFGDDDEPTKVA